MWRPEPDQSLALVFCSSERENVVAAKIRLVSYLNIVLLRRDKK